MKMKNETTAKKEEKNDSTKPELSFTISQLLQQASNTYSQ